MPFYDDITAIGAGFNVALLDLDLITALVGADESFLPVRSPGKHRRGELFIMANGRPRRSGSQSKQFTSGLMTLSQFEYISATYVDVTVYAWLTTTTPVRFNAYLDLGDQADYEEVNTVDWGWCLKDVIWSLSKIQVLA
jgi:hypothetical protein